MLKTWDIFDTLIARRCIHPHAVFQIIEQVTGLNGFAQARILAEGVAAQRVQNYKLDDIYAEFNQISGLNEDACNILKNIECETEIEQAIPITENILQVKAGDVLISDMYLPEEILRKMLLKCGLIVPVEIVVTSGGKSSGRIWRQLAEQNQFVFHIGDNETSDIKNPRDVGFDSAITILSRPNIVEQFFLQQDFEFAAYLREIRLRNPYQEEIKQLYWQFSTLNIGILIILVQLIDDLQKKCGFEYLGFCGRDTYYMWLLYKRFKEDMNESPTPSDYLQYSRKLVFNSTNNLAEYFSDRIQNRKALMIDLVGSGLGLDKLRDHMGTNFSILMCNCYNTKNIGNWTALDTMPEVSADDKNFYFTNFGHTVDALEFLNRATHNTPIKLQNVRIGEKVIPEVIFSEVNDTENLDVLENCLAEVLKTPIKWGGGKWRERLCKFKATV